MSYPRPSRKPKDRSALTIPEGAAESAGIVGGRLLYLIATPSMSHVKIGISVDPVRRMASIQTSCPLRLWLAATWPGNNSDESTLHLAWDHEHVRGEWFNGPEILRAVGPLPWPKERLSRTLASRSEARRVTRTLAMAGVTSQVARGVFDKTWARLKRVATRGEIEAVEAKLRDIREASGETARNTA